MYLYGILRLAVLFHIVVASPLALDLNVDPDRQLSFNDVSEASTVANVDRVPRPDKVPYYDPRDRGGSLLNVSVNGSPPHEKRPRRSPILAEEPMGRRRAVERDHKRSIEPRRVAQERTDRLLEKLG